MTKRDISDLGYLIDTDFNGRTIIFGCSKSINANCAFELSDKRLKAGGLEYIKLICDEIKHTLERAPILSLEDVTEIKNEL